MYSWWILSAQPWFMLFQGSSWILAKVHCILSPNARRAKTGLVTAIQPLTCSVSMFSLTCITIGKRLLISLCPWLHFNFSEAATKLWLTNIIKKQIYSSLTSVFCLFFKDNFGCDANLLSINTGKPHPWKRPRVVQVSARKPVFLDVSNSMSSGLESAMLCQVCFSNPQAKLSSYVGEGD